MENTTYRDVARTTVRLSASDDGATTPSTVSRPRLVGRAREMAALTEALAQPPSAILLEGEAGVGKSRLVEESLASRGGLRDKSLVAGCPPMREPFTLGPVIEAIRQHVDELDVRPLSGLAGALRPLFPEWASSLPAAPEALQDVRAARHRLFRALAELLDCSGVAVLVVEDVHWADEATLEFLLFLLSRRPAPLSLLVTYRADDVPADSLLRRLSSRLPVGVTWLRLSLEPLDVADTTALMSSMLDDEMVSAEFGEFVHRCTGGLPLVVEESVRLMVDRADLTHRNGEWVRRNLGAIDVTPTVRDATLERCARLGDDARAVLDAAAILGEPAAEATITAVAELDPQRARSGLTEALLCGLLLESDRGLLALRHTLAARALYDAIPGPLRRSLHLRAGRVLQGGSPPPVARLAYHFREAGETDGWCRYAERAADLALASGDETIAETLLHDLLTNAELPPQSVIELVRKIPGLMIAGLARVWDYIGVLRSLLDRTSLSAAEEAQARYLLGCYLVTVDEDEAGDAELRRAVRGLPAGSFDAARAMIRLGTPHVAAVSAAEHRRWLRRAAVAAESDATTPEQRLDLLLDRAHVLLLLGEPSGWDEAAKIPEIRTTPQHRLRVAVAHLNVGDEAMRWGRYGEAARRLELAGAIAEQFDYPRVRDVVRLNGAHLRWLTGAWDGLADEAAVLTASDDVHPLFTVEAVLVLALLAAAQGGSQQAEQHLQRALAEYRIRGAPQYLPEPAAALARLWLANGRIADALHATDESVGIITGKGIWLWATDVVPARVEALAADGRVADAAELVAAFSRGLRGRDAPAPAAALVLCRALVAQAQGEHARAATLFSRAATAWEALPRPYDALLARERQAECLHAGGRDDVAAGVLTDVYKGLSALGAVDAAEGVARRLRAHGVDVRHTWRRGRRGYGDELSPSELEVVRMVVAGATNRRIAEALSRSTKTIEAHVNSAMRKLRVTSRTALAVAALDAGVVDKRSID